MICDFFSSVSFLSSINSYFMSPSLLPFLFLVFVFLIQGISSQLQMFMWKYSIQFECCLKFLWHYGWFWGENSYQLKCLNSHFLNFYNSFAWMWSTFSIPMHFVVSALSLIILCSALFCVALIVLLMVSGRQGVAVFCFSIVSFAILFDLT